MNLAVASILIAIASGGADAGVVDRIATLKDFEAAASLCLEVAEKPSEQVGAHFSKAGWRKEVLGLYVHPANGALLTPMALGTGCGVAATLATRLTPATFRDAMARLGGHRTAGPPERGLWNVRGLPVRAWVSRESQEPGVSLLVGHFAMEKK